VKKETLITIVVFLGVGFLGGYAYNAHKNAALRQKLIAESASDGSAKSQPGGENPFPSSPDDASLGLPKGHPAVDAGQIVQYFESAAAQNPTDPGPRLKLANFLYDQQRWADAIRWYRQVLALHPNDVDAMTDMATCWYNLGEFTQTDNELHEALKIDPHHQPTLFNLIVVNLEGSRNLVVAQQAWEKLRAINPSYPHLNELKRRLDAETRAAGNPASN
jgi:tetratricopeptide (TPR) repeat protein